MDEMAPIPMGALEATASVLASVGSIDPLSNLQGSNVWLFHGRVDTTVPAGVNEALKQQYTDWGANVQYNNRVDANHAVRNTHNTHNKTNERKK